MRKKNLSILILLTVCLCLLSGLGVSAAHGRKPTLIKAYGIQNPTVTVGADFELKVKANGEDDYLTWNIKGKKGIIAFENLDRNDDEMDFHALKSGTTKVICKIKGTSQKVAFKVTVKEVPSSTFKISRVNPENITISAGEDLELKVRKSSKMIGDRQLKWSIEDTSIVGFDDVDYDEVYDDEIDIIGLRPGTTTVKCTYLPTGKSVDYTVNVIKKSGSYNDDSDWYDDWYNDDDWDDDDD